MRAGRERVSPEPRRFEPPRHAPAGIDPGAPTVAYRARISGVARGSVKFRLLTVAMCALLVRASAPAQLQVQLLELELDNLVARLPGGLFQRIIRG